MHETFPGESPERDPNERNLNPEQPGQTPGPFDDKPRGYRTRKVSLPGGRVIEIVYFHGDGSTGPEDNADGHSISDSETTQDIRNEGLHICQNPDRPDCNSDLVYPVNWEERAGDRWKIERRCPNCEWRTTDEFHQSEVEPYDDVLNEGTEDLLIGLRNFARSNMEEDVERLIDAIRNDGIQPMDF